MRRALHFLAYYAAIFGLLFYPGHGFQLPKQQTVSSHGRVPWTSMGRVHSTSTAYTALHSSTNDAKTNAPRPGSLAEATVNYGRVPYGEESRKYRRTVYTYKDWIAHRSNNRLFSNLKGIFFSGVVRQLQNEVALVTIISTAVVVWNGMVVPYYCTLGQQLPIAGLPTVPFTLSTSALALMLVFRTNGSYNRWHNARQLWSRIVAQSRNAVRMSATFVDDADADDAKEALDALSLQLWVLSRSLMNRLSNPDDDDALYEDELRRNIPGRRDDSEEYITRLLAAPDRTIAALMDASLALDAIPIDEKRRCEADKSLVIIGDQLSECERIASTPVPLVYTRHTARFLSMWMILLPVAMYDVFAKESNAAAAMMAGSAAAGGGGILSLWEHLPGLALIPTAAVTSIFLFGIEELAVQLEEPFTVLPMSSFCDDVLESTKGLIDWRYPSTKQQQSRDDGGDHEVE